MKKRLGDFELIEQIDPGGYTVVWKATQHMGHGITRPAAVKVLQHWQANSEEQIDTLRKEVELLLAVGSSPYIVEVYGFGIDDEVGPWIGMELSGRSLKHWITDQPADPEEVRAMLHDTLKGLSVVHHAEPQILHRDIKPQNIVRSKHGHWQIADFGLAKRQGFEDTMNFNTVQYAAPELLDSTLGQESPKMDLYSLGMIAYEYALGRQLYRKQFSSIFDPFATKTADTTSLDDKPKWMYWHASTAMTLPKLKELIPDFPEDVSELVAKLLAKPLRERIASAEDALGMLGAVSSPGRARAAGGERDGDAPVAKANPLALVAMVLWVLAAAGGLGWYLLKIASTKTDLVVDSDRLTTDRPDVMVRGQVKDLPRDGSVKVIHRGSSVGVPMTVDSDGRFTGVISIGAVGEQPAEVVAMRGNERLANKVLTVVRTAPKTVRVRFATNPPVPVWDMKIRENGKPNEPVNLTTDQNGNATMEIAHGQFRIEMDHPRYKVIDVPEQTGDDPDRTILITLTPLSEQRLADKREKLLTEMEGLLEKAAAGDPAAIKRLEEIRKELSQLEPMSGDAAAARRVALQEELQEVMKRAAAGDPEAIKRAREISEELRRLASGGAAPSTIAGDPAGFAAREAKRAALVAEMNDLIDRAAAGDPAAIARLKEIQNELASLEAEDVKAGGGNDRRLALVKEMAALAERAAAGDPAAIQRMREIRAEMQQIAQSEADKKSGKPVVTLFQRREELIRELGEVIQRAIGGENSSYPRMREIHLELMALEKADLSQGAIPKRRKELLAELQQTIELSAIGNADAKLRLPDIHRELATLSAIESAGGDAGKLAAAAARMMTGDPGLDVIDRGTLLGLTAEQFKAFLEINIPSGTLKVELVPHLTKVRLTGPLFSQEEYDRLMARLEPAKPRLQLEVRVDAWAVCRRLEEQLMKLGAETVRVHAHLTFGDTAMFIQFKKTEKFTKDQVFVLSRPFVLDRDMLRLQAL